MIYATIKITAYTIYYFYIIWSLCLIMSLDMFSGKLSQRHGIDQSVAGSVISAVIGHLTQQQEGGARGGGIGNLFSERSKYTDDDRMGGIHSSLSNLMGERERGQLHQDHRLIRHVQQKTGIRDPEQAREYTHHALGLMHEHANNKPQDLHSLFSNLLGS